MKGKLSKSGYRNMPGHSSHAIRMEIKRNCSICGKPIRLIPDDMEPRYVRYCLACRYVLHERSSGYGWMGRGEEHGASTGWMVIGSGAK